MVLRVALVGTGAIAHEHVKAILAHPDLAQLVAVVNPQLDRAQVFCEQYRIPAAFDHTEAMLDAVHPDIVAICSPPGTHLPLTLLGLRAGAHVVCEKPLALSLAELDQIAAVELETGRTCTSIVQWRYGSAATHVKKLIDSGEAGKPLLATCNTLWYRDAAYYTSEPWRSRWATAGGGVAMALGIHAMDMTLWLMGEWQSVQALSASLDRAVEIDTVALAHVRFASGALGSFVNSAVSPRQVSHVRLDLQHLTIELDHLYRYENADWRFTLPENATFGEKLRHWQAIPGDAAGSLAAQWDSVLHDLAAGHETRTRLKDVRPTYDFIASLYKSAALGTIVTRGSILPADPFYASMSGITP
jgi:predicted dehydrogenase